MISNAYKWFLYFLLCNMYVWEITALIVLLLLRCISAGTQHHRPCGQRCHGQQRSADDNSGVVVVLSRRQPTPTDTSQCITCINAREQRRGALPHRALLWCAHTVHRGANAIDGYYGNNGVQPRGGADTSQAELPTTSGSPWHIRSGLIHPTYRHGK